MWIRLPPARFVLEELTVERIEHLRGRQRLPAAVQAIEDLAKNALVYRGDDVQGQAILAHCL
jgi:hypothetical protein